jgi:hypothetical protein
MMPRAWSWSLHRVDYGFHRCRFESCCHHQVHDSSNLDPHYFTHREFQDYAQISLQGVERFLASVEFDNDCNGEDHFRLKFPKTSTLHWEIPAFRGVE